MASNCSDTIQANLSSRPMHPEINISETMSEDDRMEKIITYYTMEVCVPIVCCFGMVGNVLNFLVLTREKLSHSLTKMEKSAHIGLIGLAISDFMFCLLAFTYTQITFQDEYRDLGFVSYFDWLSGPCITFFIVTSTWLTVAMAGERYLAVCHPFKARKLISLKKTRIIIFMVYIICLALTIPLGFEKIIKEKYDCRGHMIYVIEKRPMYTDNVIGIRRLAWAIVFDFVPCIALLYFNICLIYKIHHAKKLRRTMAPTHNTDVLLTKYPRELFSYNSNSGSSQSRTNNMKCHGNNSTINSNHRHHHATRINLKPNSTHSWRSSPQGSLSHIATPVKKQMKARRRQTDNALNSVTATLVAVVVLFLILVSPSEVLKFMYTISAGTNTHTYKIIRSITNLMQAINFSVNFILYCAVNKSFRSSLKAIFCFLCRHGKQAFHLRTLEKAYCHRMDFSESES